MVQRIWASSAQSVFRLKHPGLQPSFRRTVSTPLAFFVTIGQCPFRLLPFRGPVPPPTRTGLTRRCRLRNLRSGLGNVWTTRASSNRVRVLVDRNTKKRLYHVILLLGFNCGAVSFEDSMPVAKTSQAQVLVIPHLRQRQNVQPFQISRLSHLETSRSSGLDSWG